MKVIYTTQEIEQNPKSIFLAGPSPRSDDVKSWRTEAITILEEIGYDGIVYNPEHVDGQEGFKNCDYPPQWEHDAIDASSVLVFWVPRDMDTMPALTTNVEFGYFVEKHRWVLYGRPDESPKNRYLDWLYKKKRPSVEIYNELYPLMSQSKTMTTIMKKSLEAQEKCKNKYKNENIKMKIKKLLENAKLPEKGTEYAAGYDLFATENYTLQPKTRHLFKTGLAMEIPEGFYGRIAPRSGLAYKKGIDVLAGVVDCFVEESLIETPTGKKTVNDLKINDKVISFNIDSSELECSLIKAIVDIGEKDIIDIETETGTLSVTEGTLIYTESGLKKAKDIKKDDKIMTF